MNVVATLSPLSLLNHRLLSAIAVCGALLFTAAPATAACAPEAEQFIDKIGTDALNILRDPSNSPKDREAAFRTLLVGNSDIRRIAIFALGQYARKPTPEQKEEYIKLVEDFIAKVYVTRLSEYSDETFEVLGSRPKGKKEMLVKSRITFPSGRDPVEVEWWLLRNGDCFKIFDVKVVGIWLAQEQRSSFTSVIRNNGNQFAALIEHLTAQIASAEAERDAPQETGSVGQSN